MSDREFDIIVIGGGPAGEVLAGRLAQKSDKRVAIVEDHLLGGECSYYACMPSKALLRPQEALHEAGRIPGAREAVSGGPDVAAVLERRDRIVHGLDDEGQVDWVTSAGIELVRGHGRLEGERRVRANGELLDAREAVVVAVGSGAAFPPIPGLAEAEPWTNREVTTASEVPRRLIILGGGVVGVEMAQAWRSLGSEVTLLERADSVPPLPAGTLRRNPALFPGRNLRDGRERRQYLTVGDEARELGRYLSADGERALQAVRSAEQAPWSLIDVLGEGAHDPRLIEPAVDSLAQAEAIARDDLPRAHRARRPLRRHPAPDLT